MAKNKKSNLFEYPVDVESYCIESHQSEEQYGEWSSVQDVSISKVGELNEGASGYGASAISSHKFKKGDTAYLVFIAINSGDSFGHGTNSSHDCVHLFENLDLAMMCAKHIELDYSLVDYQYSGEDNSKPNTISFLNDKLEYQDFNTTEYKGYFESLNLLWIVKAVIGEHKAETVYDSSSLSKNSRHSKGENEMHKLEQLVQGYKAIREKVKLGLEVPEATKADTPGFYKI